MKRMRIIAPVLVAVCLFVAALAWSQGGNPPASTKESGAPSGHGMTAVEQTYKGNAASVSQELIALENKWTEEAKKGNADGVAPLLWADYVTTDADSSVHNKAESLARIKTAKWEINEISDLQVAVHGDAAVVTGTWRGKGTEGGKSVDAHERWTDTWVRMPNGKWQCVASHSSPMK
jgi:ketosteroid isomerase-like protein